MKTVLFIGGIPGSGKSRFSAKYKEEHPNTYIIDCDETRKKITGSYLIFPKDMRVIFDDMIQQANDIFAAAKEDEDITVIEDGSFLDNYRREYFIDRIVGYDKSILLLIRMHDYSICYEYNKKRVKEKWVPEEVMDKMIANYQEPDQKLIDKFDEYHVEYWN